MHSMEEMSTTKLDVLTGVNAIICRQEVVKKGYHIGAHVIRFDIVLTNTNQSRKQERS